MLFILQGRVDSCGAGKLLYAVDTIRLEDLCVQGTTPLTIGDSQHGFRNKRSCLTSLLDFFAQVIDTNDTDNNNAVDLVYLDL